MNLDEATLARYLRRFGVVPRRIAVGHRRAKGYYLRDVEKAGS